MDGITNPPIDELLDKAGSKYSLVLYAAKRARQINARLIDSWTFETGDLNPNPQPTKAMLRTLGLAVGYCRPPMDQEPADLEDRARQVYAALKG